MFISKRELQDIRSRLRLLESRGREVYQLVGSPNGDPWAKSNPVRIEIIDRKDGWVRFSYLDDFGEKYSDRLGESAMHSKPEKNITDNCIWERV